MINNDTLFWIVILSFLLIATMAALYASIKNKCNTGVKLFYTIELIFFFLMLIFANKLP